MSRRRGHGEGSVFRRSSGGWGGAITVGIDGSGKQKRRYVYGDSQREVRQKLDTLRRQQDVGIVVGTRRGVTVGQYLESWIAGMLTEQVAAGVIRPRTKEHYSDMAERLIVPYIGRCRLEDLRPPQLRLWIAELRGTTSQRGRPLSARTIQMAHATLRRALNDAVRDELVPRNPALLVQPGKLPRSNIAPLTLAEAKALLATASTDRLYALWLVLMSLGLRRGEALALRWSDFDFEARTVRISRSLQRRRTEDPSARGRYRGELVEEPPKTEGSIRIIALPQSLLDVLKQHRARQGRQRLAAVSGPTPISCSQPAPGPPSIRRTSTRSGTTFATGPRCADAGPTTCAIPPLRSCCCRAPTCEPSWTSSVTRGWRRRATSTRTSSTR